MDYQWIYLCNTCVALCIILPDLKYTSLSSIFSFIFLFSAFSNRFFLSFSAFGSSVFPLPLFLSQVHYIQIFFILLSFLCIFMYTLIFSFILIWNLFLYSFFVITIYIVKCSSYVSSELLFYFVHECFLSSCSFYFYFSSFILSICLIFLLLLDFFLPPFSYSCLFGLLLSLYPIFSLF